MAKSKKKKKQTGTPAEKSGKQSSSLPLLQKLEHPRSAVLFAVLLLIYLVFFYAPLAFEGLELGGADQISMIGKFHQIWEFQKQTGEHALWNPAMFGGMPFYHLYKPLAISIDTFLNGTKFLFNWRIWFLWLGGLGMFFLLRYLKIPVIGAALAAFAFIMMPHYQALIAVGHNTKFRALMWTPWVVLTFWHFVNRRTITGALWFGLLFTLLMRTQHYQIIFYVMMFLFFIGIVPYVKMIQTKNWADFRRFNLLLIGVVLVTGLAIAQQVLPIKEYTPYSTRGGQAVHIDKTVEAKEKKGVGLDYATRWSYSLTEFWNLIIPKFHGGTSNELYTGDAVPQLKNQTIPAYWGSMPFTQSYEYLGILVVFFALLGLIFYWDNPLIKSVFAFNILAFLLSLGKHFMAFYKLFFYYVPYFDKFRVPSMILTMVMFTTPLLAAYGLKGLQEEKWREPQFRKALWAAGIGFLFLLVIPLLFGSSFSLTAPGELERFTRFYGAENARRFVDMLRQARLDILTSSTLRTLGFFLSGLAIFGLWYKKIIGRDVAILAMVLFAVIDTATISHHYLDGKYVDTERLKQQTYQKNALDAVLEKDRSFFRVAPPLQSITNDTRWSYYYHSIGGYSPAKLQVFQDIVDNNLFRSVDTQLPFNLNIISMLNGKYLVTRREWKHPALRLLARDPATKQYLLQNTQAVPRAYFTDTVRVIPDPVERLKFMNTRAFNPAKIAILEKPVGQPIQAPDSSTITITHYDPNRMELKYFASQPGLLVIAEAYYPKGWKAMLDGEKELPILKTNHMLRSVVVPSGEHILKLVFHPETFYRAARLSWAGMGIFYLGLILQLVGYIRKNPDVLKKWKSNT